MKKGIILATVLGLSFTLTGCFGGGAADTTVELPDEELEPQPISAEIEDEDLSALYGELPEDTEGAQTVELGPTIDSIVGVYVEADALDARTLTINSDGSYSLEYRGGGAEYGTVKVSQEIHPDGSDSFWFEFDGDNGELWESFGVDEAVSVQTDLYSGQDGSLHFYRLDESGMADDQVFENFFGTWVYERCGIDIEKRGQEAVVTVSWANGAAETYEWVYFCTYNADEYTLVSYSGEQTLYKYNEDGTSEITVVEPNAEANFYVNGKGRLVWEDLTDHQADGLEFEAIR